MNLAPSLTQKLFRRTVCSGEGGQGGGLDARVVQLCAQCCGVGFPDSRHLDGRGWLLTNKESQRQ